VLFATLSEGPGNRRNVERVPVLAVVRRYLRDIAVVRWPLGSTRVLVDHAYNPTLQPEPPGYSVRSTNYPTRFQSRPFRSVSVSKDGSYSPLKHANPGTGDLGHVPYREAISEGRFERSTRRFTVA
jgi:hypothetical protein